MARVDDNYVRLARQHAGQQVDQREAVDPHDAGIEHFDVGVGQLSAQVDAHLPGKSQLGVVGIPLDGRGTQHHDT